LAGRGRQRIRVRGRLIVDLVPCYVHCRHGRKQYTQIKCWQMSKETRIVWNLTHICPRNFFLSNYDKFVQNNLQTTTQMIIWMKLINLLN
jgi:hypothetical protein